MTAGWISEWQLERAAKHLRQGGIIAYPTEAVYGLGCDPMSAAAVDRLLALKNRSVAKGLILIAADFQQIEPFIDVSACKRKNEIIASWPGPTTWVIPASPHVPRWLSGHRATIAVRVTRHPLAAALCRAFQGPIVSTSANKSGRAPAKTFLRVRKHFPPPTLIVKGDAGNHLKTTAIYDALSGRRLR